MKEKSKLLLTSFILMFMIILFIGIGNYLGGIGNLPNACMQYVLHPEHFPYENFTLSATIISIVIIFIIGFILKRGLSKEKIKLINTQI